MRIEFANAERPPLRWDGAELRVGSAADNDLVLAQSGVASHHLTLRRDARGTVMRVQPGAGRVYVNARPVRERAFVRAGDSLGVAECRLRLCAEAPASDTEHAEIAPGTPTLAALRIVAGPLCGRVVAMQERLELGPRGQLPLALPDARGAALALVRDADGWRIDCSALPERFALSINGNPVRDGRLRHGDQIVLGAHHFLLDAWPSAAPMPEPTCTTSPQSELPEDSAGPRGEVWWLIATAAAIGLAIALLLFVRF